MTSVTQQCQDEGREVLVWRVLKFALVVGLHAALVVWIVPAQIKTPPEPAPILEVRTIEVPVPLAPEVPKPLTQAPKPLPQTARPPLVRRTKPLAPPVLAAPSADSAPAAFALSPQPPAPAMAADSAQPAVPAPAPVPMSGARFDADYLQNPAPAYPAMSRRLHEEGKVLLQVNVTATGMAEQVQIKQGSGYPRLDEAALSAVRQWRFTPARRGDEALAASVLVPIVFRLDD